MIRNTVLTVLIIAAAITDLDAKPGNNGWKMHESGIAKKIDTLQCPKTKYRCDKGQKCIPLRWICDGASDCEDKRDERNCIPVGKVKNMTKEDLAHTLKAVNRATKRDNAQADENLQRFNSDKKACPRGSYSCDKDTKCVLLSSVCDKTPDCKDESDERNCPLVSAKCGPQRFRCDDGAKCLPLTWLCDTIDDCDDKKDEYNCPTRQKGKSLVRAVEEAAVIAAREAKRAELTAQEIITNAREAADKANRALKIAENSRHMAVPE